LGVRIYENGTGSRDFFSNQRFAKCCNTKEKVDHAIERSVRCTLQEREREKVRKALATWETNSEMQMRAIRKPARPAEASVGGSTVDRGSQEIMSG